MTHLIETGSSIKPGDSKYLFFSKPAQLWQSDGEEQHIDILFRSNRVKDEIVAAGGITVLSSGQIAVDGFGSTTLNIHEVSAVPVADFIKSLEGIQPEKVLAVGGKLR